MSDFYEIDDLKIFSGLPTKEDCYNSRGGNSIKFLILHYTAANFEFSMNILRGHTDRKVSVHYVISDKIENDGFLAFKLVDEQYRAWHAGVSSWGSLKDLNTYAVGIENINLNGNIHHYKMSQTKAIVSLCKDIIKRNNIKPNYVLGHSDISPTRKIDPGSLFPWRELYAHGIGAWPDDSDVHEFMKEDVSVLEFQNNLKKYGYAIDSTGKLDHQTEIVTQAFQRHFRPSNISGYIDKETNAIIKALLKKYI